jgi:hypothetical protein
VSPGCYGFSSSNRRIYRLRGHLQVGDRLVAAVPDRFGARLEGAGAPASSTRSYHHLKGCILEYCLEKPMDSCGRLSTGR